jgi:hypothetical protein
MFLFIASSLMNLLVLDPNIKDLYCRHRWEQDQYDAGIQRLEEVVSKILFILLLVLLTKNFKFDQYYVPPSLSELPSNASGVARPSEGMCCF